MQQKIQSIIKQFIDRGYAAGANTLVLKDGKEICYAQYGFRDLENKVPMDRDTLIRLYSQTKPVTGAAAILLAEQGLIDLSQPVSTYLPEFKDMHVLQNGRRWKAERPLSVLDLLNMSSGLSYPDENTECGRESALLFDEIDRRLYTDNPMTTREFARKAAELDLSFEPGTDFLYGISADVLGALIQEVSGMSFGSYLQKYFFDPLEMHETGFSVSKENAGRLAKAYEQTPEGLKEIKTNRLGMRYLRDKEAAFESGGAGLVSTLDDYSHFATMLLDGGTWNGRHIMSPAAVKFFTHGGNPSLTANLHRWWPWLGGYTYGNLLRVCRDSTQATWFAEDGEYGWDGWLGSFFSNDPKTGMTVLLGAQLTGVGQMGPLAHQIKNAVTARMS